MSPTPDGGAVLPDLQPAAAALTAAVGFTALRAETMAVVVDTAALLPADAPVALQTSFSGDGADGSLVLLLGEELSERVIYAAGPGTPLAEAIVPLLTATFGSLATTLASTLDVGDPIEVPVEEHTTWSTLGEHLVAARVFEGDEHVATIAIALTTTAPSEAGEEELVTVPEFPALGRDAGEAGNGPLSLLRSVELEVTAELGRTSMTVREVLGLTPGAIVELDRVAGSPVDLLVNGTLIARGEVVVVDEEYGVRVTEIVTQAAGVSS
jgi:flagellar motor switch protein FliN/FliY